MEESIRGQVDFRISFLWVDRERDRSGILRKETATQVATGLQTESNGE